MAFLLHGDMFFAVDVTLAALIFANYFVYTLTIATVIFNEYFNYFFMQIKYKCDFSPLLITLQ